MWGRRKRVRRREHKSPLEIFIVGRSIMSINKNISIKFLVILHILCFSNAQVFSKPHLLLGLYYFGRK
jgi:branched-subunit amino acid transport protein AzlD